MPSDVSPDDLFTQFLDEVAPGGFHASVTGSRAAAAIFAASHEAQARILLLTVRYHPAPSDDPESDWVGRYRGNESLRDALMKRPIPLREEQLIEVLRAVIPFNVGFSSSVRVDALGAAERYTRANGATPALRAVLENLYRLFKRRDRNLEDRKLAAEALRLLGGVEPTNTYVVTGQDAWARDAMARLGELPLESRGSWVELLRHAATASSSKPSARWLKQAAALVDRIGKTECARFISGWLALVGTPRPEGAAITAHDPTVLDPDDAVVLKGLVWAASQLPSESVLPAVGAAAETCFKKIPNFGPRCVKVGNACLWYLSTASGDRAVSELVRVRSKARHASIRRRIEKSVGRQAEARGQTPEDLVEIAVPTFGLSLPGILRRGIAGQEAELAITATASATLRWKGPTGRVTMSVPKAVKEADPAAAKEISRLHREIERTLPGQRDRLERLLLLGRTWSLADWRSRFADHPLLRHMVSRLIWQFEHSGTRVHGLIRDDKLVGIDGAPLKPLPGETRVALWHPITAAPELVGQWREQLARLEVQQPFKQAHREVYVLTDAERATRVYSNRFAAHILRQHQMAELCKSRSWDYRLAGTSFDSGDSTPRREIPSAGLTASFLVEPVADNDEHTSGISRYVATDQVWFESIRGGDRLPLEEIPPTVLSEVLRDVDLFVGVCSVGNDPAWQDGGPDGRYRGYWHGFAFGDIGAAGATRHGVLARVLPLLTIAPSCTLTARFLHVKGRLRAYKIHLGSGNILMEPNDQYLCIVPGSRDKAGASDVLLPFEGDRTLSIILSKAFMLAADDQIKDPTITRQLNL